MVDIAPPETARAASQHRPRERPSNNSGEIRPWLPAAPGCRNGSPGRCVRATRAVGLGSRRSARLTSTRSALRVARRRDPLRSLEVIKALGSAVVVVRCGGIGQTTCPGQGFAIHHRHQQPFNQGAGCGLRPGEGLDQGSGRARHCFNHDPVRRRPNEQGSARPQASRLETVQQRQPLAAPPAGLRLIYLGRKPQLRSRAPSCHFTNSLRSLQRSPLFSQQMGGINVVLPCSKKALSQVTGRRSLVCAGGSSHGPLACMLHSAGRVDAGRSLERTEKQGHGIASGPRRD